MFKVVKSINSNDTVPDAIPKSLESKIGKLIMFICTV